MKKPIVLMILDGYGYREEEYGNAIKAANTPVMDKLLKEYPHTLLGASGEDVGLPDGQMGNSEVGHTNIGAGRIVYQELTRITKAAKEGRFLENPELLKAMNNAKENDKALHFMGLLSQGGVHSHIDHLIALLEMAKEKGLTKVYVHCFMDGRDVPPTSGVDSIKSLQKEMERLGVGEIATISGRYYAMDRDNRWERVEKAYDAIVRGKGVKNSDAVAVMENSYAQDVTDEFIVPTVVSETGQVQHEDSVIFFNFRPDRARELTRTLVDPEFEGFQRSDEEANLDLTYVCMTQYDATMPNVSVAFKPEELTNTFGEILAREGLTQLRIAETEKYPHVTFFFNGGLEKPYENEDRALIASPKVATYDLQPEMSAPQVTKEMLERLDSGKYDVVILNFANCDMVGHTGVFDAAVKAVETVDECMGKVVDKVLAMEGILLITADHGNADQLYEEDGSPFTAHTTNPVPFVLVGYGDVELVPHHKGILADLSPTMLSILGIEQPAEMTGESLIVE